MLQAVAKDLKTGNIVEMVVKELQNFTDEQLDAFIMQQEQDRQYQEKLIEDLRRSQGRQWEEVSTPKI